MSCLARLAAIAALSASLVPLTGIADVPEAPDFTVPAATPTPVIAARPTRVPTTERASGRATHHISGKASWYCLTGRSACHNRYPDRAGVDDLYAAACAPLRKAMGPGWRGRYVLVAAGRRAVEVRLVDYCASTGKTIDLYADAFRALAPLSRGVVKVTVGW